MSDDSLSAAAERLIAAGEGFVQALLDSGVDTWEKVCADPEFGDELQADKTFHALWEMLVGA